MSEVTPVRANPLPGEIGGGSLGRLSLSVHRYLVIGAALVIACLPTVAAAVLLPWEGLTLLLHAGSFAFGALALSAAFTAWLKERAAVHPAPWSSFWRAWSKNAVDVVRALAPALVLVGIVGVSVGNLEAAGVGAAYGWLLLGIAAIASLLGVRVIVLASVYSFRTRDLWRLAVYTMFRVPRASVALLAMLICAVGLVLVTSEAILLALGGIAARLLLHHEQPVLDLVHDQFTQEGRQAAS